ncbi:AlpA family phage regulatory protein [Burkholderia sp. A9]|uniref:AlpA family phage regulatory protein n=1 Tax=Burkholderia sp. A9 TaxID=1365108 RepID=UPI003FA465AC
MKPLCLDLGGVVQAVELSRTGVLKLMREGKFPQARQLSPRRSSRSVSLKAQSTRAYRGSSSSHTARARAV